MFKNRCYNGGNKHKFEPRYTEIDSKGPELKFSGSNLTPAKIKAMLTNTQYVYDICVWCGKIIKKE